MLKNIRISTNNTPSPSTAMPDFSLNDPLIQREGNSIYLDCEIEEESMFEFKKQLRLIDEINLIKSACANSPLIGTNQSKHCVKLDPIYVFINSPGGCLHSAISAMDTMLLCRSPIYTIVNGFVASAATLLSVIGAKRFITENSCMLIHQLTGSAWGKFNEIEDDMMNLKMLMKKLYVVYTKYTKLKEKELSKTLTHDLWYEADKCIKNGLVDAILTKAV